MKRGQFHEKYLKTHPEVPVHIPFFWYVLSGVLIFLLLVLTVFSWTQDKPTVQSSTEVRR